MPAIFLVVFPRRNGKTSKQAPNGPVSGEVAPPRRTGPPGRSFRACRLGHLLLDGVVGGPVRHFRVVTDPSQWPWGRVGPGPGQPQNSLRSS